MFRITLPHSVFCLRLKNATPAAFFIRLDYNSMYNNIEHNEVLKPELISNDHSLMADLYEQILHILITDKDLSLL